MTRAKPPRKIPSEPPCWELAEDDAAATFCARLSTGYGRCLAGFCALRDGFDAAEPRGGWRRR